MDTRTGEVMNVENLSATEAKHRGLVALTADEVQYLSDLPKKLNSTDRVECLAMFRARKILGDSAPVEAIERKAAIIKSEFESAAVQRQIYLESERRELALKARVSGRNKKRHEAKKIAKKRSAAKRSRKARKKRDG